MDYQVSIRFTRLSDSSRGSDETVSEVMPVEPAGVREHQPAPRPLRVAIVNDYEVVVAGGQTVDTGRFRTTKAGSWPGAHWGLSARESETLALVATGMPNREIAEAMFVSENTVRTHLKSIFRKLGVSNRSQALARTFADPTFAVRHSEDGGHGDGGDLVSRGA